jgi:phage-related protein
MQTGGIGLQAMADSGDLLNAALENSVVASVRAKAATVAKTVADKASAAATRVMTVAQKALNLAQRASPIGLLITGVLLLVGAVVLAYKRSETFRRIVDKALSVAKAGVSKVVNAFQALGPIVGKVASFIGKVVTTYVGVYVKAFQLSLAVVKAVWSAIQDKVGAVAGWLTRKVSGVRDSLTDAWRKIRDVGVGAFQALMAPVQAIIDLVQHLLDKISSIHLPHLPNPFSRGSGAGAGSSSTTSSRSTSSTTTVTIPVTIMGGADATQAVDFMAAVDARLRSLGKAPVFS